MSTQRGRTRPLFLLSGAMVGAFGVMALMRRLDAVEVTGSSMHPTLRAGDRLLIEALTYARRHPRVGEIVLAPDPRQPDRELVKRVVLVEADAVGLAGDAPAASTDSRTFGSVPLATVRWRAIARYWPPERIGLIGKAPLR